MKRAIPIITCMALVSPSQAGLIDFETLPATMGGGTPTDNQLLTGAYAALSRWRHNLLINNK